MTFDLIATNPRTPEAKHINVNIWYWPLHLQLLRGIGVFNEDEIKAMQTNDGFPVCATKAWLAASKLSKLDKPDFRMEGYDFSESSEGKVFRLEQKDLRNFVQFLFNCGGFSVW